MVNSYKYINILCILVQKMSIIKKNKKKVELSACIIDGKNPDSEFENPDFGVWNIDDFIL